MGPGTFGERKMRCRRDDTLGIGRTDRTKSSKADIGTADLPEQRGTAGVD